MSGPIVRSAPNPKYSNNWEQVFGGSAEKKPAPKKAEDKKSAKAKAKSKKKS